MNELASERVANECLLSAQRREEECVLAHRASYFRWDSVRVYRVN